MEWPFIAHSHTLIHTSTLHQHCYTGINPVCCSASTAERHEEAGSNRKRESVNEAVFFYSSCMLYVICYFVDYSGVCMSDYAMWFLALPSDPPQMDQDEILRN